MKIAVVGNYKWQHYQQALLDGLHECQGALDAYPVVLSYYPVWNLFGILFNTLKLCINVANNRPEVLFLYRVDYLYPWILPLLKKVFSSKILVYHNDDPYNTTLKRPRKHYFFLRSLKYSDITYVYREVNISEAKHWGAYKVKLMRSHYYSKQDFREEQNIDINLKEPSIIFIGHFEPDTRIQYLDALFKADINLHIYGHDNWRPIFESYQWPLDHLHSPLYGLDYRVKLHSVYAALAFFSERNRDDYTRRCFEIPMAGTLLLAPCTNYMERTFSDGTNAMLFSNTKDIVAKAKQILEDKNKTESISLNGYKFIANGGFSEIDVAKIILKDIIEL